MGTNNRSEILKEVTAKKTGLSTTGQPQKYQVHKNEVYERRLVHSFSMSDVEDPELYAALPIGEWQATEKGKWVMKHCYDPAFHIHTDYQQYGYRVNIIAGITPKRWTEFVLRGWDQQ